MGSSGVVRFCALLLALAFVASCGSDENKLAKVPLAPPTAFVESTEPTAHNGNLSDDAFNEFLGDHDAATEVSLENAYQKTYDNTDKLDSILVVIAEMEHEEDAQQFADLAAKKKGLFFDARADPAVQPTVGELPGVAGGTLIEPTVADKVYKTFDHAVVAVKGNRVMFIDYLTHTKGKIDMLPSFAQQQYAAL